MNPHILQTRAECAERIRWMIRGMGNKAARIPEADGIGLGMAEGAKDA